MDAAPSELSGGRSGDSKGVQKSSFSEELSAFPILDWRGRKAVQQFIKDPQTEIFVAFLVVLSCALFTLQTLDGMMGGQPGGMDLGQTILSTIDFAETAIGQVP